MQFSDLNYPESKLNQFLPINAKKTKDLVHQVDSASLQGKLVLVSSQTFKNLHSSANVIFSLLELDSKLKPVFFFSPINSPVVTTPSIPLHKNQNIKVSFFIAELEFSFAY